MDEQWDEDEFYSDDDSEQEEDEEDENCPNIRLSRDKRLRIRRPWLKTLILKVLGKRMGFKFLERQITQLWNPKGMITLADLGNDYYIARFFNDEDYDKDLFKGLWIIADHYLIVQQQRPKFDLDQASIKKVIVWVCIPNLPIEYYDKTLLQWIGNMLGHTIRVDVATEEANRAKYARLSVEVDLSKPLIAKF